ncbi:hypothetical protein ILT44_15960 [Microvirga sp. BT689]|uniref:hypothetical protein n=1 Tax=Microvirga arvi TaxID=2778731 RepID=UPI00194EB066|nr:hypothetical protein [Microvirga arvi]MBM6581693.1 hypothetical protein [Microvirga arvi]
MRNYNLFCRADRDELVCAVPEDRAVPSFITGPTSDFVGQVKENVIGSLSFNHEAAEASVRWNGFYLFQLINASDLHRKACQGSVAEIIGDASAMGIDPRQKAPGRPSEIRLTSVDVTLEVGTFPDKRASFLHGQLDNADLRLVRK